jgi:hypothetical protein
MRFKRQCPTDAISADAAILAAMMTGGRPEYFIAPRAQFRNLAEREPPPEGETVDLGTGYSATTEGGLVHIRRNGR